MIKIQVIGHLGKDCNVNTVNGKTVINFSVAHSEKYKDAAGVQHDKTIWVNCGYWVERPALAQYLKKGTMVFAEGQPEVSTYKASDNTHRAELKMRVLNVQLLGGGERTGQPQNSSSGSDAPVYNSAPNANNPADEDLPF